MEKIRVLLIEDDAIFSALINQMLSGSGYEIQQEVTLEAGVSTIFKGNIDVVLLDLSLPDMINAPTALRRFFEAHLEVAVLILSNHLDPLLTMKALELGAQGYLIKGKINSDWLQSAIFQAVLIRQYQRRYKEKLSILSQELYQIWEGESVRLYKMAEVVRGEGDKRAIYEVVETVSGRLAKLADLIAPEIKISG